MRILPAGERALLVELPDLDAVLALHQVLRADPPDGVADLVPAARTVLVTLLSTARADQVARALRRLRPTAPPGTADPAPADPGAALVLPVEYTGADLAEVAATTGLTEAEVVAAHTGTPWRVAFCGFAPGFGYLVGGNPRLRVPRRATSRVRVPAGSVALADRFTGVYPTSSPGGWQLVGRTDAALWQPDREPAALLRPGVTVRFEAT